MDLQLALWVGIALPHHVCQGKSLVPRSALRLSGLILRPIKRDHDGKVLHQTSPSLRCHGQASTAQEISTLAASVSQTTTFNSISIQRNPTVTNAHLAAIFGSAVTAASISISGLVATIISMPSLRTVSGNFQIVSYNNLNTLTVPNLVSVGALTLNTVHGVSRMSFSNLTTVSGAMLIRSMNALSGTMFADAFASLQSVGGLLSVLQISRSGGASRSTAMLPALQSAAGLNVHYIGSRVFSCPVLTTLSGPLTIDYNTYALNFDFPSLRALSGPLTVTRNPVLTNLCGLGSLTPSGFTSRQPMSIGSNNPNLNQMPLWIARNASLQGTVPCSSTGPLIVSSLAEYNAAVGNATFMRLSEIGAMIITWPAISNAQLNTLLQWRTVIGELVIESCTALTDLNSALGSVVNVSTRLVLENLPALQSAVLPNVQRVGGGVWLTNCRQLTVVAMPSLQIVGGSLNFNQIHAVQSAAFGNLTAVGGAMFVRSINSLTGIAFSRGFATLQSVGGLLSILQISRSGGSSGSTISLPSLRSTGGLTLHYTGCAAATFPVLANVSGPITLDLNSNMRTITFPRMTSVGGSIRITRMSTLATLCPSFPLLTTYPFSVIIGSGQPQLTEMPTWMSASAGVTATPCPTAVPTASPTGVPTAAPTTIPTWAPTWIPTLAPTAGPTATPSTSPSRGPTSAVPTAAPTATPTASPTVAPTSCPTPRPSSAPTVGPTRTPSTGQPTARPTTAPTPPGAAATGASSSGTSNSVYMILVAAVVVVILAGLAVYSRWTDNNQSPANPPMSSGFANPMYDAGDGDGTVHSAIDPDYADLTEVGYMDIAADTESNGGFEDDV